MKLSVSEQGDAVTNGVRAQAFNFEMNAKMYDMMIAKLYKDKHGAIVRELCCNAYDSHVEAGNPDEPYDLHLPTWLDRTFYIRDYGTGIPHESFRSVYTDVGKSTKEESNDQIGAYGLGSKSPLALADTYTIENYYGGTKSTWACFKSGGVPQVTCMGTEATNERSGLKVSISFAEDHNRDFINAARKQLRFFPVKPRLLGAEVSWDKPELIPDGKRYRYLEELNQSYVVMGNVAYPFTSADFGVSRNDPLFLVTQSPIAIRASLSEVDIPPSRESLELTQKTKDFLSSVARDIQEDYVEAYLQEAEKNDTLWDLMQWYNNTPRNRHLLGNVHILTYNRGHNTVRRGDIANDWGKHVFSSLPEEAFVFRVGRDNCTRSKLRRREVYESEVVYVDDLGTGGRRHLASSSSQLPHKHRCIILRPAKAEKREKILPACQTQMAQLKAEGVPCKLLSDVIGLPVKQKRVPGTGVKKAEPNQIFTLGKGHGGMQSRLEEYKGPLPTSGYAIEMSGYRLLIDKKDRNGVVSLLSKQEQLTLLTEITKRKMNVYLVRSKTFKKLKGLKDYKELIKDMWHAFEAEFERDLTLRTMRGDFSLSYSRSLELIAVHCPELMSQSAVKLWEETKDLPEGPGRVVAGTWGYRFLFELAGKDQETVRQQVTARAEANAKKVKTLQEKAKEEMGSVLVAISSIPSYHAHKAEEALKYIQEKMR